MCRIERIESRPRYRNFGRRREKSKGKIPREGRGEDDFRRETSGAYIYGGIETSWESFWSPVR